jgi:hypothetical protein
MPNREHLALLKKGVPAWNRWRAEHLDIKPELNQANLRHADLTHADLNGADLSGADLSSADLIGANVIEADLHGTNLSGADLHGADLSGAKLSGANLSGTNLSGAHLRRAVLDGADLGNADLRSADLSSADLSGADLSEADLSQANLIGADLGGAKFGWSLFGGLDLSKAKRLDETKHYAPSTIGIDTIYKSGGKIPDAFLRGAGVPDNFIAYIGSLVGRPIEFYSCFISYSTRDQLFAERLHADLQAKGVRCWFAPEDIAGGKKLHEQIDEAIRLHDRLLLILSPASMSSKWVKTEIAKARKREERDKRRVLFPVRLVGFEELRDWECFDADIGIDSAAEIREYFIPDFSQWKDHDQYKKAFDRLLRDLKAESAKAVKGGER